MWLIVFCNSNRPNQHYDIRMEINSALCGFQGFQNSFSVSREKINSLPKSKYLLSKSDKSISLQVHLILIATSSGKMSGNTGATQAKQAAQNPADFTRIFVCFHRGVKEGKL